MFWWELYLAGHKKIIDRILLSNLALFLKKNAKSVKKFSLKVMLFLVWCLRSLFYFTGRFPLHGWKPRLLTTHHCGNYHFVGFQLSSTSNFIVTKFSNKNKWFMKTCPLWLFFLGNVLMKFGDIETNPTQKLKWRF